jgi:hypothetical protein
MFPFQRFPVAIQSKTAVTTMIAQKTRVLASFDCRLAPNGMRVLALTTGKQGAAYAAGVMSISRQPGVLVV